MGSACLRPETVRQMQINRLTDAQRQIPFAGMPLWQKSGFGLGLSIAEDLIDNPYAYGAAGNDDLAGHIRNLVAGRSAEWPRHDSI